MSVRSTSLVAAVLASFAAACVDSSDAIVIVARAPAAPSGPAPAAGLIAGADVTPILRDRAPLSLAHVLELSGSTPNIVRFAKERVAEADADLHRTQAIVLLPTVRLVNELEIHQGAIQFEQSPSFASTGRRDFAGLRVTKDYDLYGGYQDLEARGLDRDAAREQLGGTELTSAEDAAENYFDLQEAQAGVAIARDALARAKEFLGVASAQERERLGLTVDRLRAEAEVAKREEMVVAAEERFRVASATLATFLRLDPTVLFFSDDAAVRPITFVPPDTNVDALIQSAYATRPDLRAEHHEVEARRHELDRARIAPFVPHLVVGLVGQEGGLGFELEGADPSNAQPRADYYLGVQWELAGAGVADYFGVRTSEAKLRTAIVHEQDKAEHVARQIIEAHQAVRSRFLAIEAARHEVSATEEAYTIAFKRFEQGVGIMADVLAANEARALASTHLVDAISLYNKNQFRLLSRIGERPDLRSFIATPSPNRDGAASPPAPQ